MFFYQKPIQKNTAYQILFGWSNQEEWVGRACSIYGGEERYTEGFGG